MGLSNHAGSVRAVGMNVRRGLRARAQERTARRLQAAERAAEAAAARYRALRDDAAAPAPTAEAGRPRSLASWQQLLLLIVGGGVLVGMLMIWLLAAAYVGPLALLVLPLTAGSIWGYVVLRRRRPPAPVVRRNRPTVADLVRATQEMREAEAAVERLRDERGGRAARPVDAPAAPNPWGARSAYPTS
jgi:hypothetical protein